MVTETSTLSHAGIIEREGDPTRVAGIIDVDHRLVKGWKRNDNIPGKYWRMFVDSGLASYRELADAADVRVRLRAAS